MPFNAESQSRRDTQSMFVCRPELGRSPSLNPLCEPPRLRASALKS